MAPRNFPYAFDVDATFYYATYPDVAASGIPAAQHYHLYGWHEGRNPDSFFDTAGYLASNPDVAAAGIDPLAHFHRSGFMEGRLPSPAFDAQAYLAANPDVAAAGVDPLAHYLHYGQYEGRAAPAKPLYDADGAANTVGGHAAAGTGTGVTFSWGGFVSPNLTYALTGDTSGGGFTVDAHTGQVIVADGSKVADASSYAVTVTASDLGHTISQTATITTGGEANNKAPAFDATPPLDGVQTNEGYPAGMTIYAAHATDADTTAPNNTVHYTLAAGVGDNDAFNVDANGNISFKAAPDYERPTDANHDNTYDVTVTATDGGSPARSATETVSIHVQNQGPSAPVDSDQATPDTVAANAPAGTYTGITVQSSDGAGALIYSIVNNNNFTINAAHQVLTASVGASGQVEVAVTDGTTTATSVFTVQSTPAPNPVALNSVSTSLHVAKFVAVDGDEFQFSSAQTTAGTGSASTASPAEDHATGTPLQDNADAPHWAEIAPSHASGADTPPDAGHDTAPAPVHVDANVLHG